MSGIKTLVFEVLESPEYPSIPEWYEMRFQSAIALAVRMGGAIRNGCRIKDDACRVEFRWWFM